MYFAADIAERLLLNLKLGFKEFLPEVGLELLFFLEMMFFALVVDDDVYDDKS